MKKVLMISYYYPPLADVGSLRALGFSKNITRYGWEPYVLSVKNPDRSCCIMGDAAPPDGIKVFYTRSLFNLNRLTYKINGAIKLALRLLGRKLGRNIIHDIICVPDVYIGWVIPCFVRGMMLAKKHDIDVVYVSVRPFSSAISGVLIKKVLKKKLVLDFRDPVTFPAYEFSDDMLGRLKYRAVSRLERFCLNNTDMFMVTTDETRDTYLRMYPFLAGKSTRIYNGYSIDEDIINRLKEDGGVSDRFTITYSGNFYFKEKDAYPPEIFFEALRKIVEEGLIPREKLRFLYVGRINEKNNWLRRMVDKYRLEDVIAATGQISREESFSAIARSSMLLLRIVRQMISTKLYEGLAAGVPLLATIDKGEVERIIRRYSANSCIITTHDANDVAGAIVEAYGKWKRGELNKSVNSEFLKHFNKKTLSKEFAAVLDGLLPPADNGLIRYDKDQVVLDGHE